MANRQKAINIEDILPEPFEWIRIPRGKVKLQYPFSRVKELIVVVDDFFIAKYPITNEQFNVYLNATNRTRFPQRVTGPELNRPKHPVIDLWWHEAMQYCEWLSAATGYMITLPTDAQWQRAAQGDDNRRYPWGNNWDNQRCNSEHNQIAHTTPVTHYPQGASPFGVMDMVGNVEEWTCTDSSTGESMITYEVPVMPGLEGNYRNFRGGSYLSSKASANCISSGAISANWYSYLCGIRLVKVLDQFNQG